MSKSSYKIRIKMVSLVLAVLMSSTVLVGCDKESKNDLLSKQATTTSSQGTTDTDTSSSEDETQTNETTTASKNETTSTTKKVSNSANGSSSTATVVTGKKSTTTTTKKLTTDDSGLSNKNTVVDKATDASDLKNVDAETAAKQSSNTEIAEVNIESGTVSESTAEEYPYIDEANFESHILSVWKKIQVTDKVKIKKELVNEYLNYVVLPLKGSFYEINCQGYETEGVEDDTYAYLTITYHYYVSASQYAQCKSAAQAIVNKATGSTTEKIRYCHDYIGAHTTYVMDVDGAYNNLIKGQSDCDGYTAAFQLCMELLGVPCKAYCTENHIFNLVQISGSWYAVDVTWDDADDYGVVLARYYLRGKSMYSSYTILNSMLASSDYTDSRKAYIYDKEKLASAIGLSSSATITPKDNGYFDFTDGNTSGYFSLG